MTVLTEQEKCNEQLLQQLRDDVAAVTPDPWDKILARVQAAEQPEPETVVPLPQRSRRGGAWRRWVAAAAVFLLAVLGGGFYAVQTPDGVATLDANPSIELTVNKLGRVLSVRACNADAQVVLDELELRNQPLQTAADAIVAELQADGYVSADTNSILVTVEAGKGDARLPPWRMHRATAGLLPLSWRRCWSRIPRWRPTLLPWASVQERRCSSGRSARRWRISPARRWRCCRSMT